MLVYCVHNNHFEFQTYRLAMVWHIHCVQEEPVPSTSLAVVFYMLCCCFLA